MKKAFIFCLVILMFLQPAFAQNDEARQPYVQPEGTFTVNDFTIQRTYFGWTPCGYYEIGIIRYTGTCTSVTIPCEVDGLPVIIIWGSAFIDMGLTEVIIPGSVRGIGAKAFANNRLTDITLPDKLSYISGESFANNLLTHITIPDSVTDMSYSSFSNNPLISITIGKNVHIAGNEFNSTPIVTDGFEQAYNANGMLAGTYIRPNAESTTWTWSE
jgi:hypothetical protein